MELAEEWVSVSLSVEILSKGNAKIIRNSHTETRRSSSNLYLSTAFFAAGQGWDRQVKPDFVVGSGNYKIAH